MTYQKGHKGYWLGKKLPKKFRIRLSMSRSGPGNSFYGKHHTTKTKQKISQAFTNIRKEALIDRNMGNDYLKDFLKRLTPSHKELWLKDFGRRISLAFTPLRREEYAIRMHEYRISHPIWTRPNWNDTETGFSVPAFVPLLPGRIKPIEATRYYTQGIIPQGISSLF